MAIDAKMTVQILVQAENIIGTAIALPLLEQVAMPPQQHVVKTPMLMNENAKYAFAYS